MRRILFPLFTMLLLAISFAFHTVNDGSLEATFGVSEADPSNIELTLKKDYTFSYQDFSNPIEKINVDGTYVTVNNKIHLNAANSEVKFHDKWRIKDNGNTVVSRKGLTFYTIRKK